MSEPTRRSDQMPDPPSPEASLERLEEALDGGDPTEVVTAFDEVARTAPEALQERSDLLERVAALTHSQLADIGEALRGLREFAVKAREEQERSSAQHRELARAVEDFASAVIEVRSRGEELLERAEKLREPELASVLVEHLRGPAVRRGNWRRVLDLERRLAHVAAARGELVAEIVARCDEALALSQLEDHGAARTVAEDALERAVDQAPDLVARAALVLGRVHEEAGDPGQARTAYAALMERLDGQTEAEVEWGLAAAGIARTLEEVVEESQRRRRLLEVARSIAERHDDPDLYREALLGFAELEADAGDVAAAVGLAVEGRIRTSALGGHAMAAPFDAFLAELDDRFGRDVVQAEFEQALHAMWV